MDSACNCNRIAGINMINILSMINMINTTTLISPDQPQKLVFTFYKCRGDAIVSLLSSVNLLVNFIVPTCLQEQAIKHAIF